MINKDLSNSYVRVEVICDREGFWLKPHCDIKEKLMSGLCSEFPPPVLITSAIFFESKTSTI